MPTPSQPLPYATPTNPNLHPRLRRAANHLLFWAILHYSLAGLFALAILSILLSALLALFTGSLDGLSTLCCVLLVPSFPLLFFLAAASRCKNLRKQIAHQIPGTLDSAITLLYLFLIPTAAILLGCIVGSTFLLPQTPYDTPALLLFAATLIVLLLTALQLHTLLTLYRARRVEPPLSA